MTTVTPEQWQGMRARFLQRYPDFTDFSNPGEEFAERELNYKRAMLHRFEQLGLRSSLPKMVEEGKGQEALKALQRVKFGNLISSFHFWSVQFGKTDQQACTVIKGLLETASEPYAGPETLVPLLEATKQAETKADWDVMKILWLFRPDDYFPVGISMMRKFAWHLGVDLEAKQRISTQHYPPVRDFVMGFAEHMADWKPRDLTDVQSAVWDMAYHEIEEEDDSTDDDGSSKGTKGREDPPIHPVVAPNDRIWIIAAGPQACYWDDWYRDGYIALGWEIGDASAMLTKHAVREALQESGNDGGMNDVHAMFQFAHEMRMGDRVFVKQGRSRLMGCGVINSDYRFEGEEEYPHRRSVKWTSGEAKDVPANSMPNKTLTLLAPHRPNYQAIIRLYPQASGTIAPPPVVLKRYTRDDALRDLFMSGSDLDRIMGQLRRRKNIVLQGPPGVGKTFIAKRLAYLMMEERDASRVKMIQFHQSYSYEDFIQGFRPCEDGSFRLHYGHFYDFCKRAEADEDNDYFFVIDEINRGNLSKIFGELLVLLEADKRGDEHRVGLAYSSGDADEPEEFWVPDNLHVIGTMNTADKSLALVDFAMRRRFAFVSLRPQFGPAYQKWMTEECGIPADFLATLVSRVTALNEEIAEDRQLGSGCCIGHSFFTPDRQDPPTDWAAWLEDVVLGEIEPLLNEYWPDDPDRVEQAAQALLA